MMTMMMLMTSDLVVVVPYSDKLNRVKLQPQATTTTTTATTTTTTTYTVYTTTTTRLLLLLLFDYFSSQRWRHKKVAKRSNPNAKTYSPTRRPTS